MRVETLELDSVSKEEIDQFLSELGNRLVYYSVEYNAFLSAALPDTSSYCLLAFNETTLVGLLWFHVAENDEGTRVCNSLPFFGGHGGAIAASSVSKMVNKLLLNEFVKFCEKEDVASTLIVENMFDRNMRNHDPALKLEVVDTRIGQMTSLPVGLAGGELEDALFGMFHVKTRNAVRKGLKHIDSFSAVDTLDAWQWLEREHTEGILALNGLPKSAKVFASLRASQLNIRLYVAGSEGRMDAGLVVILYGDTVEYFTPVSTPAARSSQVLSALIYLIMTELTLSGYKVWNWGGTWQSQAGVYRFKSRFGADDFQYCYYGRSLDDRLLMVEPAELQRQFPYYYVRRY